MPVKHLPADTTGPVVAAMVKEEGAVVVDELVPPGLMETIESELRPYLDATSFGPDDFSGVLTRRTGSLIARSPAARQLVMHDLALATTKELLAHATNFQLHLTQAIAIGPGQPAQPIHKDRWAFDFFPFPTGYEVQCNTIRALTDFTEANGATRIVLGSNSAGDSQPFTAQDTEPAEMDRGSVLFYSGSVNHGGGANQSDQVRIGINITYNLAWLRQEENQYLATPAAMARTLPVELLRLMGYDRGAYCPRLHRRPARSDRGHPARVRRRRIRRGRQRLKRAAGGT